MIFNFNNLQKQKKQKNEKHQTFICHIVCNDFDGGM